MTPSPTLAVCTVNVLFERYYQAHCKVSRVVTLSERTSFFSKWIDEAMQRFDVIALQEWPYPGTCEQAELWNPVLQRASAAHGFAVVEHSASVPTRGDGLVTCVRKAAWTVCNSCAAPFSQAAGNRGTAKKKQGTVLRSVQAPDVVVGVINAHAPWAPWFDKGCHNVSELFTMVDTDYAACWVAVGDWNLEAPKTPEEAQLFARQVLPAGWTDFTQAVDTTTCAADRGFTKIDYITGSPGVHLSGAVECSPADPSTCVKHKANRDADPELVSWFSDHVAVSASFTVHPPTTNV